MIARSIASGQVEIGWIFNSIVQGRGFATEAATALMALAFETLGAHRVFAMLMSPNRPSAGVAERLGMVREARLRETNFRNGEWVDTLVYGATASEYATRREAPETP